MTTIELNGENVKVTKIATRTYLKDQLGQSEKWAKKALIEIFNNQTEDEIQSEYTSELNGIGFTGTDGEILTSFAKQLKRRGSLSPKQMAIVYKKMPKYWKQILQASDEDALNLLVAKNNKKV